MFIMWLWAIIDTTESSHTITLRNCCQNHYLLTDRCGSVAVKRYLFWKLCYEKSSSSEKLGAMGK